MSNHEQRLHMVVPSLLLGAWLLLHKVRHRAHLSGRRGLASGSLARGAHHFPPRAPCRTC